MFASGTEDNLDTILVFLLQHILKIRDLAVGLFLINDMDIYVKQQCLQTWADKAEILFTNHLLKTSIRIFLNKANDWPP